MRKSTFALALSFLVAVAWFGLQGNRPRAAEDAKPAVQKWEYHLEQMNVSNRPLVAENLNKLGNDGWELATAVQLTGGGWDSVFTMKRPSSK